jgi:hypothetical protein
VRALHADIDDITTVLWNRRATLGQQRRAKEAWLALAARVGAPGAFGAYTHLIFKRSFPFGKPHGSGSPDVWDVLDAFPTARIVVMARDPCAATYSALRRGFDTDLRRLAVECDDQLSRLAGIVRALDPQQVRVVSYSALGATPEATLAEICAFAGIPFAPVREAAIRVNLRPGADDRYRAELPGEELTWLDAYFDGRRRRQWEDLFGPLEFPLRRA